MVIYMQGPVWKLMKFFVQIVQIYNVIIGLFTVWQWLEKIDKNSLDCSTFALVFPQAKHTGPLATVFLRAKYAKYLV